MPNKKGGGREEKLLQMIKRIKHQMDEEVEIKKTQNPELTHWAGDRWQAKLLTALCLIFMLLSDSKMMMK